MKKSNNKIISLNKYLENSTDSFSEISWNSFSKNSKKSVPASRSNSRSKSDVSLRSDNSNSSAPKNKYYRKIPNDFKVKNELQKKLPEYYTLSFADNAEDKKHFSAPLPYAKYFDDSLQPKYSSDNEKSKPLAKHSHSKQKKNYTNSNNESNHKTENINTFADNLKTLYAEKDQKRSNKDVNSQFVNLFENSPPSNLNSLPKFIHSNTVDENRSIKSNKETTNVCSFDVSVSGSSLENSVDNKVCEQKTNYQQLNTTKFFVSSFDQSDEVVLRKFSERSKSPGAVVQLNKKLIAVTDSIDQNSCRGELKLKDNKNNKSASDNKQETRNINDKRTIIIDKQNVLGTCASKTENALNDQKLESVTHETQCKSERERERESESESESEIKIDISDNEALIESESSKDTIQMNDLKNHSTNNNSANFGINDNKILFKLQSLDQENKYVHCVLKSETYSKNDIISQSDVSSNSTFLFNSETACKTEGCEHTSTKKIYEKNRNSSKSQSSSCSLNDTKYKYSNNNSPSHINIEESIKNQSGTNIENRNKSETSCRSENSAKTETSNKSETSSKSENKTDTNCEISSKIAESDHTKACKMNQIGNSKSIGSDSSSKKSSENSRSKSTSNSKSNDTSKLSLSTSSCDTCLINEDSDINSQIKTSLDNDKSEKLLLNKDDKISTNPSIPSREKDDIMLNQNDDIILNPAIDQNINRIFEPADNLSVTINLENDFLSTKHSGEKVLCVQTDNKNYGKYIFNIINKSIVDEKNKKNANNTNDLNDSDNDKYKNNKSGLLKKTLFSSNISNNNLFSSNISNNNSGDNLSNSNISNTNDMNNPDTDGTATSADGTTSSDNNVMNKKRNSNLSGPINSNSNLSGPISPSAFVSDFVCKSQSISNSQATENLSLQQDDAGVCNRQNPNDLNNNIHTTINYNIDVPIQKLENSNSAQKNDSCGLSLDKSQPSYEPFSEHVPQCLCSHKCNINSAFFTNCLYCCSNPTSQICNLNSSTLKKSCDKPESPQTSVNSMLYRFWVNNTRSSIKHVPIDIESYNESVFKNAACAESHTYIPTKKLNDENEISAAYKNNFNVPNNQLYASYEEGYMHNASFAAEQIMSPVSPVFEDSDYSAKSFKDNQHITSAKNIANCTANKITKCKQEVPEISRRNDSLKKIKFLFPKNNCDDLLCKENTKIKYSKDSSATNHFSKNKCVCNISTKSGQLSTLYNKCKNKHKNTNNDKIIFDLIFHPNKDDKYIKRCKTNKPVNCCVCHKFVDSCNIKNNKSKILFNIMCKKK